MLCVMTNFQSSSSNANWVIATLAFCMNKSHLTSKVFNLEVVIKFVVFTILRNTFLMSKTMYNFLNS